MNKIVGIIDAFVNKFYNFEEDYGKWVYIICSIMLSFVISIILAFSSNGLNFIGIIASLLLGFVISFFLWLACMLFVGLLSVIIFCIRKPFEALITTFKIVLAFIAIFLFGVFMRTIVYGGSD